MGYDLFLAAGAVVLVGLGTALFSIVVAKKSLALALIVAPLTVVVSIASGLLVGLKLMLIEGAELVLLVLGICAPLALLIGILVSATMQRMIVAANNQVQALQKQRELERAQRDLLGAISHDLKTPLAGIRAMAEALEDGVAPDPKSYYRKIGSEARRTASMVEEMLGLAKLQSGAHTLTHETIALNDLISDVVAAQLALAREKGISLHAAFDAEEATCEGDAQMLGRAIQNIVANAIAYSHENSTIELLLEQDTHWIRLGVRDACGGLSDAAKEHMFETGWRDERARTPDAEHGSGLGLAIVKSVSEAHGGRAYVEPLEDACIVWMVLPRAMEASH